ncbi:MAG: hypothetical protein M1503_03870 [Thaumarchaeota archaeon]|nr:hypothetical protein [Nitrososphaerota archaeon]MCL5317391.1 hypothetical protein [Nitrososphaerota archaeon]
MNSEAVDGQSKVRLLPMFAALVFLLLGLVVGGLRLMLINGVGISFPPLERFYVLHSEITVLGFLGLLIMFERAVGVEVLPKDRRPATVKLMIPIFAAGLLLYLAGRFVQSDSVVLLGGMLMAVGSLFFAYVVWWLFLRVDNLAMYFMLLGIAALTTASLVATRIVTWDQYGFALLLLSYPMLFIIGERVDLTRFGSGHAGRRNFKTALAFASTGLILLIIDTVLLPSTLLLGGVAACYLVVISVTYRVESMSLRRISKIRYPINRYVTIHTTTAYYWITAGLALLLLRLVWTSNPFLYDAFIHSIGVGFVGTMILAHGPIILPAIMKRPMISKTLSLIPLLLLSLGNLIRVAGDLVKPFYFNIAAAIGYSGLLILIAVLAFFIMMIHAMRSNVSPSPSSSPSSAPQQN